MAPPPRQLPTTAGTPTPLATHHPPSDTSKAARAAAEKQRRAAACTARTGLAAHTHTCAHLSIYLIIYPSSSQVRHVMVPRESMLRLSLLVLASVVHAQTPTRPPSGTMSRMPRLSALLLRQEMFLF